MRGMGLFKVKQLRCGFPFRCCSWEHWSGAPKYSGFTASSGHDGDRFGRCLVPRTLLWPGFAVNTLFYAGVLWVLFCGPFALRRMIRRRRGRCPACNYPIGQSPVCTECGQLLTS